MEIKKIMKYIKLTYNGRTGRLYRVIMEKHLKRRLLPSEVVHHIDGNEKNNKLSNLMITTHSKHRKLHIEKGGCKC